MMMSLSGTRQTAPPAGLACRNPRAEPGSLQQGDHAAFSAQPKALNRRFLVFTRA